MWVKNTLWCQTSPVSILHLSTSVRSLKLLSLGSLPCGFTTELRRRYRDFPHSLPHTRSASRTINIIHQNGAFCTKDEPALTPYNHPRPIAYISVHAWWLHSIGMRTSTTTYTHPYSHTELGLSTKRPRGSVYSSPPALAPGNHQSSCLHNSAFPRRHSGWKHTVWRLFRLASFSR